MSNEHMGHEPVKVWGTMCYELRIPFQTAGMLASECAFGNGQNY